jgi:putative NADPH-quinone reductase
MRILYLYCHPLEESFHAAIRREAVAALEAKGHEVDVCDLYAEGFDPVLTAERRRNYHDVTKNRDGLEEHVARLQAAEALVVQFPTWCFGLPAMLKGWFDRLLMPGVAFDISDPANVKPMLGHLRHIVGISTYGRQRWVALYVGDPPRKVITRYLPRLTSGRAKVQYHALYHMNVATQDQRQGFIERVRGVMGRL